MPLTKTITIDKIEVTTDGTLQVREVIRAFDEDGTLIGERYHRMTHAPGDVMTSADPRVQKIAAAVWDATTMTAYRAARPVAPVRP